MDGTIDFIILEHDDVAGCALIAGAVDGVVPAIDGYNTPYVVAKGYDHATRNWEDCTLFDDIVKAKLAYEGLRGREYSLDGNMRRDDFATSEIRGFTDAELAIEIEKAGAAMVEQRARHLALPAPNRAALPAHLAPDRPARDGLGGDARHIRRHGGVAGISRA